MLYGKVNQCYFGVEKLMFLTFLEHKEFLKISHFTYAIYFAYNFVTFRHFDQFERLLM